MPIMTRMRESMPVILFGLLIAFLITIIFEWGMDYLGLRGNRSDAIGSVNGKTITYREFSDLLKVYTDNAKAQTGKEPEEEQLKQIRDQVWQTLITQNLVDEQIKKLGLTVTDQELVDWVRGPNPPEDLRRNFVDSTGQFRRDVYDQFLSNPNQFVRDPNGRDQEFGSHWLADYEKGLRQRRLNEKLQSLVMASVQVSPGELRERFLEQSQKASAAYALFDASRVNDNDVQVTDADLKAYYEDHLDQFKVEASRKLKYVAFPVKASPSDSAMRLKDIQEASERARSGSDFLQVVSMYSDRPDSGAWFRHGELQPNLESAVFSAKGGDIVGPVQDADGYRLVKVLEERKGTNEYVHASHILFMAAGADSNAVKKKAEEVAREARQGKDFAALAREYSQDQGNASRGGDLGWFARGRMVPAFDKAAFGAKVGEVVGPVRTQFGWHIIKVIGRDNRELKLATITARIEPSSQTKNDLVDRARDFAFNAGKTDFGKEAKETGLEVREAQVQEKSQLVPGLGIEEGIVRWAFANKVGSISDQPFSTSAGEVILTVAEAKDAGVRSFDEVKESLRPATLRKKKLDKTVQLAADVRAKLGPADSLTRIEQIDPAEKVQHTGEFVIGSGAPGVGRDPAFQGAVQALAVGRISPPVEGQRGAYLIQVADRTPFDSTAFAAQRTELSSRLLQEKKTRFLNDWLTRLRESSDIEDHRDLFFRD